MSRYLKKYLIYIEYNIINMGKYEQLTPSEAMNLKKGRKVYFYQAVNAWKGFDCSGVVSKVFRGKSGILWAEVSDIKSLDSNYAPKKTTMRKQVALLYKYVK